LFIYDDNFLSLDQILEVSQTVTKNNKNIIWHTLKNTSGILQYAKIKDNNITISEDEQYSHAGSFNKTRLSEIHNIGNDILQTFAKKHKIKIKENRGFRT